MDATRPRRTRCMARRVWYAHWRQLRFARFMGVINRFSECPIAALNSGRHNWGFCAAACRMNTDLLLGLLNKCRTGG
jgi:hypothetical protein